METSENKKNIIFFKIFFLNKKSIIIFLLFNISINTQHFLVSFQLLTDLLGGNIYKLKKTTFNFLFLFYIFFQNKKNIYFLNNSISTQHFLSKLEVVD